MHERLSLQPMGLAAICIENRNFQLRRLMVQAPHIEGITGIPDLIQGVVVQHSRRFGKYNLAGVVKDLPCPVFQENVVVRTKRLPYLFHVSNFRLFSLRLRVLAAGWRICCRDNRAKQNSE